MFSGKEKKTAAHRKTTAGEGTIKAFLGAGSEFEGRMTFKENMRIDGIFRGEISSSELLIVGETATLQAEVVVGSLIINGRFQGNITAAAKVELRAPARVAGDIASPSVSIEEGVVFNGVIKMDKRECRTVPKDEGNLSVAGKS